MKEKKRVKGPFTLVNRHYKYKIGRRAWLPTFHKTSKRVLKFLADKKTIFYLTDNLYAHEEDAEDAGDDQLSPGLLVNAALSANRVAMEVWRRRKGGKLKVRTWMPGAGTKELKALGTR